MFLRNNSELYLKESNSFSISFIVISVNTKIVENPSFFKSSIVLTKLFLSKSVI
jgi:hypothetical protein